MLVTNSTKKQVEITTFTRIKSYFYDLRNAENFVNKYLKLFFPNPNLK